MTTKWDASKKAYKAKHEKASDPATHCLLGVINLNHEMMKKSKKQKLFKSDKQKFKYKSQTLENIMRSCIFFFSNL